MKTITSVSKNVTGQIYVFVNVGATLGILGSIGILRNVYVDVDKNIIP